MSGSSGNDQRSIVDVESAAFRVAKAFREEWLAAHPGPDCFRRPGHIRLGEADDEPRPISLTLNALDRSLP